MKRLRVVNTVLSAVAIALAVFAIYLAIRWDATNKQLAAHRTLVDSLHTNYEIVRTRSAQTSGLLRALSDSNIQHIELSGMPIAPNSEAYLYWNKDNGQVYINPVKLPELQPNEYYQVWAFKGDTFHNLGLINMNKSPYLIQRMRDVQNADEFVVNIVSSGEKSRPLLEKVVVAGQ
jgi:hypothetical protein